MGGQQCIHELSSSSGANNLQGLFAVLQPARGNEVIEPDRIFRKQVGEENCVRLGDGDAGSTERLRDPSARIDQDHVIAPAHGHRGAEPSRVLSVRTGARRHEG